MATIKEEIYQRMAQEQAQAPEPVSIDQSDQNALSQQEQMQVAGPEFQFSDDVPASETIYRQFIKNPEEEYAIDDKKAEKARKLAAFSDFASLIAGGIAAAGGGNVAKMDNTATEQYNNTYSKMYDYYKQSKDRYNTGLASAVMQDSRYKAQMDYNRDRTLQQYNQNKLLRQQQYNNQKQLQSERLQQQDEQLNNRTAATKQLYDYKAKIDKQQEAEKFNNQKALKKIPAAKSPSTATKKKATGKFTGKAPGGLLGR